VSLLQRTLGLAQNPLGIVLPELLNVNDITVLLVDAAPAIKPYARLPGMGIVPEVMSRTVQYCPAGDVGLLHSMLGGKEVSKA